MCPFPTSLMDFHSQQASSVVGSTVAPGIADGILLVDMEYVSDAQSSYALYNIFYNKGKSVDIF